MHCRNCAHEVAPQAIACPKCGVPPLKGKNFCNTCGSPAHPDAVLCVHCGVSFPQAGTMHLAVDKKLLLGTWSRYSFTPYVLVLLISLMPFVNFTCRGEKVYEVTGLNLAVGKERTYTETVDYGPYGSQDWERKETIFSWDICLFYLLTLASLGLLVSSHPRRFPLARNLTLASLVLLIAWVVTTSIKISEKETGLLKISFGAGFWLTIILTLLSATLLFYYVKECRAPLATTFPPAMPEPVPYSPPPPLPLAIEQREETLAPPPLEERIAPPLLSVPPTPYIEREEVTQAAATRSRRWVVPAIAGALLVAAAGVWYFSFAHNSTAPEAALQTDTLQTLPPYPDYFIDTMSAATTLPSPEAEATATYYAGEGKVYFYDAPDALTRRDAYLTQGDAIQVSRFENGFGYGVFTSPATGQTTSGWLYMVQLNDQYIAPPVPAASESPVLPASSGEPESPATTAAAPPAGTVPEEDPADYQVYNRVEVEASFKGGEGAWRRHLERNLNASAPVDNGAAPGSYTVVVRFIVDREGTVSDVRALTNHGYGMEEEAVRVILRGPRWEPALLSGRQVASYRKQPITFVVAEE